MPGIATGVICIILPIETVIITAQSDAFVSSETRTIQSIATEQIQSPRLARKDRNKWSFDDIIFLKPMLYSVRNWSALPSTTASFWISLMIGRAKVRTRFRIGAIFLGSKER